VAIKKVLQDKRYKNRELQTMRLLDHPNVVSLKHCFFSTTEKDELYLNLVLEYVPETVNRVIKHYNKLNQRMPLIYVKLYTYQVCLLPFPDSAFFYVQALTKLLIYCRSLGHYLIFIVVLESAIGISSLKIYWYGLCFILHKSLLFIWLAKR